MPDVELAWVRAMLSDSEWELWCRFGPADRRHTVEVAHRAVDRLSAAGGGVDRAFVSGALLHDIGKLDAGLGTIGRVTATVAGRLMGARARRGTGRVARHLRHEELGAQRCEQIGSDPATVALVAGGAAAPPGWVEALRAADDSI